MKKVHFRGFKLIRLKVNQNSTASPQSNQRARNEPQRAFYWNGSKDGWHQCHLVILNWNYNSKLQTDHKRFSRQSTFPIFLLPYMSEILHGRKCYYCLRLSLMQSCAVYKTRDFQSVVFNSGQKMDLRAFYFIISLIITLHITA